MVTAAQMCIVSAKVNKKGGDNYNAHIDYTQHLQAKHELYMYI